MLELVKAYPETSEKDGLVDNSALSSIKSNPIAEFESTDKKFEKVSFLVFEDFWAWVEGPGAAIGARLGVLLLRFGFINCY